MVGQSRSCSGTHFSLANHDHARLAAGWGENAVEVWVPICSVTLSRLLELQEAAQLLLHLRKDLVHRREVVSLERIVAHLLIRALSVRHHWAMDGRRYRNR